MRCHPENAFGSAALEAVVVSSELTLMIRGAWHAAPVDLSLMLYMRLVYAIYNSSPFVGVALAIWSAIGITVMTVSLALFHRDTRVADACTVIAARRHEVIGFGYGLLAYSGFSLIDVVLLTQYHADYHPKHPSTSNPL